MWNVHCAPLTDAKWNVVQCGMLTAHHHHPLLPCVHVPNCSYGMFIDPPLQALFTREVPAAVEFVYPLMLCLSMVW